MDLDFPHYQKNCFPFPLLANFKYGTTQTAENGFEVHVLVGMLWSFKSSLLKQATGPHCYILKNSIKAQLEDKTTKPGIQGGKTMEGRFQLHELQSCVRCFSHPVSISNVINSCMVERRHLLSFFLFLKRKFHLFCLSLQKELMM